MTTKNLNIGRQVKGTIREIAFGGSGILKIEGFVLFVPFTAPGDEIVAEIVSLKKGYGEAKLIKLIQPSTERTNPKCPHFSVCMGCQFQHIKYENQLEIKRKNVKDALTRIGKLEIPDIEIIASEKIYEYRERITLHLNEGKLGYIQADNKSLLKIDTCPIFSFDKALFDALNHLFHQGSGRIQVTKDNAGYLVYANLDEFIEIDLPPAIKGLYVDCKGKTFIKGSFSLSSNVDGLKIEYTPQTFIQNNFSQSLNIYRDMVSRLKNCESILDLYSGIGITSLLLQKEGKKTLGIEANPFSVKLAKQNGSKNRLCPQFKTGKAEDMIEKALNSGFDAIILNPPREGADKKVMNAILKSGVEKVLYVSCMPSTLARDLSLIREAYRVAHVKAYDMFPQTAHVETLVELNRCN